MKPLNMKIVIDNIGMMQSLERINETEHEDKSTLRTKM